MLPFRFVFTALLLFPLTQDGRPEFLRWSAEDLSERNGVLSTRMRSDQSARETLVDYGNPSGAHRIRFIRHDADGVAEQHVGIEDVVFVQSGSGSVVVGGDLVGRTGGIGEYTGTDIEGGVEYAVGAGDVIHIPKRPGEPNCTWADISKANQLLNWNPKVSLEDGVEILLDNMDYWSDAPIWDEKSIAKETEKWFEYLS